MESTKCLEVNDNKTEDDPRYGVRNQEQMEVCVQGDTQAEQELQLQYWFLKYWQYSFNDGKFWAGWSRTTTEQFRPDHRLITTVPGQLSVNENRYPWITVSHFESEEHHTRKNSDKQETSQYATLKRLSLSSGHIKRNTQHKIVSSNIQEQ